MGGSGSGSKSGGGILGRKGGAAPTTTATPASPTPVTTEYEADKPQIMPVYNSPTQLESARRRREQIAARSGRTSTNLVGNPGTRPFQSSFLGNVQ